MENTPISKMIPTDFIFGFSILSFLHKAIEEINDWGAYIQETEGETDQLKGINFCLDIIKKHLY